MIGKPQKTFFFQIWGRLVSRPEPGTLVFSFLNRVPSDVWIQVRRECMFKKYCPLLYIVLVCYDDTSERIVISVIHTWWSKCTKLISPMTFIQLQFKFHFIKLKMKSKKIIQPGRIWSITMWTDPCTTSPWRWHNHLGMISSPGKLFFVLLSFFRQTIALL